MASGENGNGGRGHVNGSKGIAGAALAIIIWFLGWYSNSITASDRAKSATQSIKTIEQRLATLERQNAVDDQYNRRVEALEKNQAEILRRLERIQALLEERSR